MSYTALYRKFRPASFDEVKGQDPIVRTLKNQVASGHTGHAYLFCGTRGTGKTSVAKVLAKAVNCEQPVDGNPCNTCAMCREIAAGASMNAIEIDAASNNGVDNIRQVIEEVAYPPAKGRYKVYIIDEVHMLSTGAFNALLKTLEEPPAYVMFILATTEAHKVPVTIMSRCQRYDFRRIAADEIAAHLKYLARQEQLSFEDKALEYIARQADGAMRDALSLLDQCIAFNFGGTLAYDKVLEVLGTADTGRFYALTDALFAADAAKVLNLIDETFSEGKEPGAFVSDLIWHLRNLLLTRVSGGTQDILGVSAEDFADIREQAERVDTSFLMHAINMLSELSATLRVTTQKRVMTEVCMIRLCHPEMGEDIESLEERVRHLEQRLEGVSAAELSLPRQTAAQNVMAQAARAATQAPQTDAKTTDETALAAEAPKQEKAVQPQEASDGAALVEREWGRILSGIRGMEKNMLEEAKVSADDASHIRLSYAKTAEFTYNYVVQFHLADKLTALVKKKYGVEVGFRVVLADQISPEKDHRMERLQSIVTIPIEEE